MLLFSLLALPSIQSRLASYSANLLSKRLNAHISIESLAIKPGITVGLENLKVYDKHEKPILSVKSLDITRFSIRLKARKIQVAEVTTDSLVFMLHTQVGDSTTNLMALLGPLGSKTDSSPKKEKSPNPWSINVKRVSLHKVHFEHRNFNQKPIPYGIDWNHNIIQDLYGEIKDFLFTDTLISAKIRHLEFLEGSGFAVSSLKGEMALSSQKIQLEEMQLKTPSSNLDFDYLLTYDNFGSFRDFVNDVQMKGDFKPSRLALDDLVYFVPPFKGLDNFLWITGSVSGSVANLGAKNLKILTGKNTRLLVDFTTRGLPDVAHTHFDIHVKDSYCTQEDLTSLRLPSKEHVRYLQLPPHLDSLKYGGIKGFFTGSITNFNSKATLHSNLGEVATNIHLYKDKMTQEIAYNGTIEGKQIQLGNLSLQQELLEHVDVQLKVKGRGTDPKTMVINVEGSIDSLWFMQNQLNQIAVNASMENQTAQGKVVLHDELASVNVEGTVDLDSHEPHTNLTIAIKKADLYGLHFTDSTHKSMLTGTISADLYGYKPDKINGTLSLDTLLYDVAGKTMRIDHLLAKQESFSDTTLHKVFTIQSDLFDLYSTSSIPYADLVSTTTSYLGNIMPQLMQQKRAQALFSYPSTDFMAEITWKNTHDLLNIFFPPLRIAKGSRTAIGYNGETQEITLGVQAKQLLLGGITMDEIAMETTLDSLKSNTTIASKEIILMKSESDTVPIGLQNFTINALAIQDSIHVGMKYDDFSEADHYKGYLNAYLSLSNFPAIDIGVKENMLTFRDTTWQFYPHNHIHLSEKVKQFKNVGLTSKNQDFIFHGSISRNPLDTLHAKFDQMNLQILDIFLPKEVRFNGMLDGFVNVSNLYNTPHLAGNLFVKDFTLNKQHLGDMVVKTSWNKRRKHIDVNADLIYTGNIGSDTTLYVHGYYAPSQFGHFDFDIGMKNFNVQVIKPWLTGIATQLNGRVSGKLKALGTPKEPELTGKLFFFRTGMKVDYTKVDYTFADEIYFMKNSITFKDFVINDPYANQLIINGGLTHNHFKDFNLDMDLAFEKLNVLHTTGMDNAQFYGSIYSSGNLKIKGLLDQLYLKANINTDKGTDLYIPVTHSVDVGMSDFITFVNPYDTLIGEILTPQKKSGSIAIDTRMKVDHNTNLYIYLPDNMGEMKLNGYGDIQFLMDERNNYEIFGDYEIAGGTFLFTLQDLIRKSFEIRPGGTLKLAGDPDDATINVQAVYHVRAGLNGLPTADTTLSSQRVPVECVLGLKGSVSNPIIDFNIAMPNAENDIRDLIFSTIDTSNNTIMAQQMLSLLILNSFIFSDANSALTSGLGATSFDLLTNQLSNWLSQISKDFDIGINYRPGDEITREEVEVALRTQLFNDRVIIDGNIGVIGADNTQNASNVVGDVTVEVKITEDGRLRVKAFNKSNERDVLRSTSPYTQGVGISYFTEFDNFKELFQRKRKRKKRK